MAINDGAQMSFIGVYRERGDKFLVEAKTIPADSGNQNAFEIHVIRVFRNDPGHAIQYQAGDVFTISGQHEPGCHPQLRAGWSLTVEG